MKISIYEYDRHNNKRNKNELTIEWLKDDDSTACEIKYVPARTCEYDYFQDARSAGWQDSVMCQGYHMLKCGHRVPGDCCELPNYCCVCGARVVGE